MLCDEISYVAFVDGAIVIADSDPYERFAVLRSSGEIRKPVGVRPVIEDHLHAEYGVRGALRIAHADAEDDFDFLREHGALGALENIRHDAGYVP